MIFIIIKFKRYCICVKIVLPTFIIQLTLKLLIKLFVCSSVRVTTEWYILPPSSKECLQLVIC